MQISLSAGRNSFRIAFCYTFLSGAFKEGTLILYSLDTSFLYFLVFEQQRALIIMHSLMGNVILQAKCFFLLLVK